MRGLLFVVACWLVLLVHGQSAVLSAGGDALGTGGSVSFSLGQLADDHPAATTGNVQEGVQQPYVDGSTSIASHVAQSDAYVYPTVTVDLVTIVLQDATGQPCNATLIDAQGRTVLQRLVSDARTDLSLTHLACGVYQLLLVDAVGAQRSFTIIKADHP